ncbi:hypothetical protein CPAR01_03583 [Colletotrichum paranaense]|uniref:Uncharacterized protein n=6 Tax=Colletotrichum acutatum species complex TaxID=2707335 RepID=A0A9Q8SW38_9PEZI|nr:uncharacterized protein CLUP02_10170 [Colletotrichum lupini]XP_060313153.1 uncharacterized protein CCOS01_08718 [Colletotrichum costaricense]XP_060352076.1 uncharacterized protein CPAR01_03583 [Colletotrichum paranaense]XP_060385423.1 uncharacterized protein CTAM01_03972 [Colletotrichum tamarilloi]XP_060398079.1 uncharacterized protein CABS01_01510 [Colletotrichum abscissum]KAI3529902.1 hypothetical protein CSPX01_15199 [Colletotrichum filicis]KAK1469425.1 hypothetical protein CMEL01_01192
MPSDAGRKCNLGISQAEGVPSFAIVMLPCCHAAQSVGQPKPGLDIFSLADLAALRRYSPVDRQTTLADLTGLPRLVCGGGSTDWYRAAVVDKTQTDRFGWA